MRPDGDTEDGRLTMESMGMRPDGDMEDGRLTMEKM